MRRRPTRSKNVTTLTDLQEQVTLLTTEMERLKTILAEPGLNNILTSNTRTQNKENVENKPRGSLAGLSTPDTPKSKGCSCRGNCAMRVCGCVPCAELCRSGDELCKNQEPDKENIGDPNNQAKLSKDGEDSLKKLSQLSLNDKTELKQEKTASAAPLNKQIEKIVKKPGLFSPGPSNNIANLDNNEYVNGTLSFGDDTDSDEIFDKNDENAKKLVEPTNKEKKETKNVASTEKEMKKSTNRVETMKKETKNVTTTRKETKNDAPSNNLETETRKETKKMVDKKREKKPVAVKKEEEEEEEKDNGEVNVKSPKWITVKQETVVKIEDKDDEINENVEQPNEENLGETSHDSGNSEPSTSAMSPNSDVASGNNLLQPEWSAVSNVTPLGCTFGAMLPRRAIKKSKLIENHRAFGTLLKIFGEIEYKSIYIEQAPGKEIYVDFHQKMIAAGYKDYMTKDYMRIFLRQNRLMLIDITSVEENMSLSSEGLGRLGAETDVFWKKKNISKCNIMQWSENERTKWLAKLKSREIELVDNKDEDKDVETGENQHQDEGTQQNQYQEYEAGEN